MGNICWLKEDQKMVTCRRSSSDIQEKLGEAREIKVVREDLEMGRLCSSTENPLGMQEVLGLIS